MAIGTQNNPVFIQRNADDPLGALGTIGYFVHVAGTNSLYFTEYFDGQIRLRTITGVTVGTDMLPPGNPLLYPQTPEGTQSQGFYHPIGTNHLYFREGNGTDPDAEWIRLSSVIVSPTGDPLLPPVVSPHYVESLYHPHGSNSLYFLENIDEGWRNMSGVLEGQASAPTLSFPPAVPGSFYHPIGTNRLYFLETDNGTLNWVQIAGDPGPVPVETEIVYYVDSVNGSNTNTGTQASPFETLEHAYSLIPPSPIGACRIMLIGAGPYTLPDEMQGVTPGPYGEPLMICGDTMFQEFTGTVTAVSGASIQFGGSISANAWRGFIYHGLTGSSAGRDYQIARNTSTNVFSIGGTFSASNGDTFQTLRPVTQLITSTTNLVISGPGKVGFWRCGITCTDLDVVGANVLFDQCTIVHSGLFSCHYQATCQFMATAESEDFKAITGVGTQLGKVGAFFNNPVVEAGNSIRVFEDSVGIGYLVTRGGLDTWSAGSWKLLGTDINLATSINSFGVVCKSGGYLEMNTGYHYIVVGGVSGVGIRVDSGGMALLTTGPIVIEQAGIAALIVEGGGVLHMDSVAGSAGNAYGVVVRDGGMLFNHGGNTVTGAQGDVITLPDAAAVSWTLVGYMSFSYPRGVNIHRTPVADAPYVALVTDQLIAYTSLTVARTVSLPDPADTGASAQYIKRITVQDESGNASALLPIVVSSAVGLGPNTIENAYGSRSFYTEGTSWFTENFPTV